MSKYILMAFSDWNPIINNDRGIVVRLNGEMINSKAIEVLEKQYHIPVRKNEHYEDGVLIYDYYTYWCSI